MFKVKWILTFAATFGHSVWANGPRIQAQRIGQYFVSLSKDAESEIGEILIRHRDKPVLRISDFGVYHSFGNLADGTLKGKDPYTGHDFTKSGHPNLVLTTFTGGGHCCHILRIYELGEILKNIATLTVDSSEVTLKDLDYDGVPEIEFYDRAIDYLFACFACSPGGRTVLKYKKGRYEVDPDLMREPMLSDQALEQVAMKLRSTMPKSADTDLPRSFLEAMMGLSYSGHFNEAMRLAGKVWPAERAGLDIFRRKFESALNESEYAVAMMPK